MSRRRAVTVAAAAVAALVLVLVLTRGSDAPADRADELVPADTLLYVHASTDPEREEDRRLLALLERFDAFAALRERAESEVGAFDFERDVRPWLGDEAALAADFQGVVLLLSVRDEAKAQGLLTRVAGEEPAARVGETVLRRFEGGAAAFTGGFLAIGEEDPVRAVIEVSHGDREALADVAEYAEQAQERPDERSLDGWADAKAPGLLLPEPFGTLVGEHRIVADASITDEGLRVRARRLGGATSEPDFEPGLLDGAPEDAFGYLSVRGLRTLGLFLPEAAGDAAPDVVGALEPLLGALEGEVAVTVAPTDADPAVTLSAHPEDPAAAREALAGMQGVIAGALTGSGNATGAVPVFVERDIGNSVSAFALTLAGGGELVYAVTDDRVAISNSEDGVRRAVQPAEGLASADDFEAAVTGPPDTAQALAFVAASQLLELADTAGLDASAAYRAARADLARIRAVGAVMRRQGDDTTVELNLLIP